MSAENNENAKTTASNTESAPQAPVEPNQRTPQAPVEPSQSTPQAPVEPSQSIYYQPVEPSPTQTQPAYGQSGQLGQNGVGQPSSSSEQGQPQPPYNQRQPQPPHNQGQQYYQGQPYSPNSGQPQPPYGQESQAYGQPQPPYGQEQQYNQGQPYSANPGQPQPPYNQGQQYNQGQSYQYQEPYQSQAPVRKDHIAAGLLGIFLGSLGIHKFYLGYNTSGFIMLAVSIIGGIVTCSIATWVVWLIGIIEGIIYLTKSQDEFDTLYVFNKKEWF